SNEASDAQELLTEAVVKDEAVMRFPETEPGFRMAVVRCSAEDYRLVLTLSALCADEVSLPILARQIFAAYESLPAADGSDPVQYIQFSEWQHELAESEESEAGRAFWLDQQ